MANELTEQQRAFLIGLSKLTRETGVIVGACGCCGSPFLRDAKPEVLLDERAGYACTPKAADGLTWVSPANAYDWQERSHEIVR